MSEQIVFCISVAKHEGFEDAAGEAAADYAALTERARVLEDVAVVALDIDARLDAGRSVAVNSDLHIRLSRALAVETANRISSPTLLSGSAEA